MEAKEARKRHEATFSRLTKLWMRHRPIPNSTFCILFWGFSPFPVQPERCEDCYSTEKEHGLHFDSYKCNAKQHCHRQFKITHLRDFRNYQRIQLMMTFFCFCLNLFPAKFQTLPQKRNPSYNILLGLPR